MKFTRTLLICVLSLSLFAPPASTFPSLNQGSSLSSEKPKDILTSPNGVFSAGFYPVGENAYCFAIWFTKLTSDDDLVVVWMANRDQPVNGRRSKLSLLDTGDLILTDAGKFTVWATNTLSRSSIELYLYNTGNLVLRTLEGEHLWESFDFPTNTLLPQQLLTRNTKLVSSRSQGDYSSGFYKLFFVEDNLLHLLYDGLEISSMYWPHPWLVSWDAGRNSYNSSRVAELDSFGNFSSSDDFTFMSADYGQVLHRRLTVDYDGNVRLYSWDEEGETWIVSWQAIQNPCTIHGICGANSMCRYIPGSGRKCSCLPGHHMKNRTDWSYGCEPEFVLSWNKTDSDFLQLSHVEFYGYDYGYFPNYTLDGCKSLCLRLCNYCIAFQYKYDRDKGFAKCYPKTLLLNGHQSPNFEGSIYLRIPKRKYLFNANTVEDQFSLHCSSEGPLQLNRMYLKSHGNWTVKFNILWFVCGLGGLEIVCIFLVWCLLTRTRTKIDQPRQPAGLKMS